MWLVPSGHWKLWVSFFPLGILFRITLSNLNLYKGERVPWKCECPQSRKVENKKWLFTTLGLQQCHLDRSGLESTSKKSFGNDSSCQKLGIKNCRMKICSANHFAMNGSEIWPLFPTLCEILPGPRRTSWANNLWKFDRRNQTFWHQNSSNTTQWTVILHDRSFLVEKKLCKFRIHFGVIARSSVFNFWEGQFWATTRPSILASNYSEEIRLLQNRCAPPVLLLNPIWHWIPFRALNKKLNYWKLMARSSGKNWNKIEKYQRFAWTVNQTFSHQNIQKQSACQ